MTPFMDAAAVVVMRASKTPIEVEIQSRNPAKSERLKSSRVDLEGQYVATAAAAAVSQISGIITGRNRNGVFMGRNLPLNWGDNIKLASSDSLPNGPAHHMSPNL